MAMKKAHTNGRFEFPQKKEERSREAPADSVEAGPAPPQELAKSCTAAEARELIGLKIQPIRTEKIEVTVEGETLITHKWSEKSLKEMLLNQQRTKEEKKLAKINRDKKEPQAEFEGAKYIIDGRDSFPSNAFKKAMVSAGFGLGVPRSIIQRCIFVEGEHRRDYAEVKFARVVRREDAVRVGPFNKREADLRYRPEYQNWSCTLNIVFRSDILTAKQVLTLLEHAGFSVGVGEWRAEKDGQAGRFWVSRKGEANAA